MEDKSPGGTGSALGEQLGPWPFFLYSCAKMWYLKRLPGSLGLAQVRSRESFLHWPSHSNPTVISVNNGWTEQQAPGQLLLQTIFFKLFSFNTVKLGRNRFSVTTLLTRNIKLIFTNSNSHYCENVIQSVHFSCSSHSFSSSSPWFSWNQTSSLEAHWRAHNILNR